MSSLITKFLINSAYNYDGDNVGDPKYDMKAAIPNFTYYKYTQVTGFYYSLTYGTAALFSGKIADKFKRKKVLVGVCIFWNFTSLVTMMANHYWLIATMRIMFGALSAFTNPMCYSMISDIFPPERRPIANSVFIMAVYLGIALSSLATILVGSLGWRNTYGVCGIYGIVAAFLLVSSIKEPGRAVFEATKEKI